LILKLVSYISTAEEGCSHAEAGVRDRVEAVGNADQDRHQRKPGPRRAGGRRHDDRQRTVRRDQGRKGKAGFTRAFSSAKTQ
jgi:hypothetical protein